MLNKLAPHSRVWVFQANRFLSKDEEEKINSIMGKFIPQWASHGNELYGDFCVDKSLFIIVGADEKKALTSGCSIDELTRVIKKIGEEIKVNFFDRLILSYEDSEKNIKLLSMPEFKALMKKDQIKTSTMVFNNLIETKEDLDTRWHTSLKNSWHKNLIDIL